MMFGAILGSNATLIGDSAIAVAAGIGADHGKPDTSGRFLRYGLPPLASQLAMSAQCVLSLFFLMN